MKCNEDGKVDVFTLLDEQGSLDLDSRPNLVF